VSIFQAGSVVAERYRIDALLGEGGMGVVYAATHTVTGKRLALKVLRENHAKDATTRHRFMREARASCAVHHPNVLEIDDVIELADGTPLLVMDLLEGESFGARLEREKKLSLPELAPLMLQVVSAVGTAHQMGVVHRDLKPDNIFLERARDGGITVKVLDFGIAKVTLEADAAQSRSITGTGAILGTPYYMAPEQMFGERDVDHRADIWSLGVILYEALAGVRPTQAENIGQVFKIVMTNTIKPIEKAVPELPLPIAQIVGRMLSRDRDDRPGDLREVAATLKHYASLSVPAFGSPRSVPASTASSPRALVKDDGSSPLSETLPAAASSSPDFAPTISQADLPRAAERTDPSASTQSPMTLNPPHGPRVRPAAFVAVAAVAAALVAVFAWRGAGGERQGSHGATTSPTAVAPAPAIAEASMPLSEASAPVVSPAASGVDAIPAVVPSAPAAASASARPASRRTAPAAPPSPPSTRENKDVWDQR
jgi:serine/threonine-protein kinase